MTAAILVGIVAGAIASGTSVLYATMGEIVGQRAGVVNLGIEGVMLVSAAVGYGVTSLTGSPLLGVAAAAAAGASFQLVFALFVVSRRTVQLASGLALWMLGAGLSALIGRSFIGTRIDALAEVDPSFLPDLLRPLVRQDVLVYLALPAALALWWVLQRTRWGLHLRAVGEDRAAAFAAGLRPSVIQYQALVLAGAFSGLGAAQLALGYARTWQEGMTAGRGFVAVAIVIFSLWHPVRAVAGALLFGGAVALGLQLQALGAPVSPFLLDMLPYVLTLLVVLVWGRPKAFAVPMGLRAVFEGTAK